MKMNDNAQTRRPKTRAGAPKGNQFAAGTESKNGRRMINFNDRDNERITTHLEMIDMTWPEWSRETILEKLDEESL